MHIELVAVMVVGIVRGSEYRGDQSWASSSVLLYGHSLSSRTGPTADVEDPKIRRKSATLRAAKHSAIRRSFLRIFGSSILRRRRGRVQLDREHRFY